ncbi:MAG: HAMP domain-containing sensor histidine kinase [Chitinophagaceae bacterium]
MKLFARYNRTNLINTAILFVLSAIAYYFIINRILVREVDEELLNYKLKIEHTANTTDSLPLPGQLEDLRVVYKQSALPILSPRYSSLQKYDPEEGQKETFRQLSFTQQVGNKYFLVTISRPLESTQLLTRTLACSTAVMLMIIILISFVLNQIILKKLWRPFYDTIKEIKKFRISSNTEVLLPPSSIDEFNFLNTSLTSSIRSAQTDYRLLKEFTENASHELQTPVAIIRSKLDLLIQGENLTDDQINLLKSAYAASKRITRLNQSLLFLVKIENHQFSRVVKINLTAFIREKLSQFAEFFENDNIHISVNLEESSIVANPDLTDALLNNLIGNAITHNHKGGKINIHLTATGLTISNSGGPHQLDPEKLFRRFYKEETHSHHNGLGLSIIKQICDQSGIAIDYSFRQVLHEFSLTWQPG